MTFLFQDAKATRNAYTGMLRWSAEHLAAEVPPGGEPESVRVSVEFPDGNGYGFRLSRYEERLAIWLYARGHWYEPIVRLSPRRTENEARLLELFKALWSVGRPYVAYIGREMQAGIDCGVSRSDARRESMYDPTAANIARLNLANLLSHEFVVRFGRETLLGARTRLNRVEELEDGSILIVPQAMTADRHDRRLNDPLYVFGVPPLGAEGADAHTYRALLDHFTRRVNEDPDGLARLLLADEAAMAGWRRFLSKLSEHAQTDVTEAPHPSLAEAPWPEFALEVARAVGRGTVEFDADSEEDLEGALQEFGKWLQEATNADRSGLRR